MTRFLVPALIISFLFTRSAVANDCVFRGRVVREAPGSHGRTARIPVPGVPVIVARKPVSFFRGRELARTVTDAHGMFLLRAPCSDVALVALFMAPDHPTGPLRLVSSMHRGWNELNDPSPNRMNEILMGPYTYPGKGRFARYEFP